MIIFTITFRTKLSIIFSTPKITIPIIIVAIVDCKKFFKISYLKKYLLMKMNGIIKAKNSAIVVPNAAPTAPYFGINKKLNITLEIAAQIKEIIEIFSLLIAGRIWQAIRFEKEIKKTIEQRILIGNKLVEKLVPQKIKIKEGDNKKTPSIIGCTNKEIILKLFDNNESNSSDLFWEKYWESLGKKTAEIELITSIAILIIFVLAE